MRSATIKEEASKCIVVCANCHRAIHAVEIDTLEQKVQQRETKDH